jgi:ribonucleotide monophosphatase NagD (HAD superfamily)
MPFILAIDFDGTLFLGSYPNIKVIEQTKAFKKQGAEIILWTCREGFLLEEAVELCRKVGITFDAINDNCLSQKKWMEEMKSQGYELALRKIFANLYVDDRANGSIDYFLTLNPEIICATY